MEEVTVVIVGASPAGLATSACLNQLSISNIVLEKEDCSASPWKKRAYGRLKLHLAKEFCELPLMPFPSYLPTFVPRSDFVRYLDDYESKFKINPRTNRSVEYAMYNEDTKKWLVKVKNTISNVYEYYVSQFLVVATGENSEGVIPRVLGLDSFTGEYIHSCKYENGKWYNGKDVLVVGCGNSGMEIAYDLSNWGARTSLVVRNPVHVLTKEIVFLGMLLLKLGLPCKLVDSVTVMLSKFKFGKIYSKRGLKRPIHGPFSSKEIIGRAPTIDVGAMTKIGMGEIQVFPGIKCINGNKINFEDGKMKVFDAIVFSTGYKSTVRKWLKDGIDFFNNDGMPKQSFPNHWKGENGLYSVGFSRRGLHGISIDARNIARDINNSVWFVGIQTWTGSSKFDSNSVLKASLVSRYVFFFQAFHFSFLFCLVC